MGKKADGNKEIGHRIGGVINAALRIGHLLSELLEEAGDGLHTGCRASGQLRQIQPLDGPLRGHGITVLQIAGGLLSTDPGDGNSRGSRLIRLSRGRIRRIVSIAGAVSLPIVSTIAIAIPGVAAIVVGLGLLRVRTSLITTLG